MAVDDERREFFVVIDFGEHNHHVRESPVGDPHLLAVDDVVLAVFGEPGLGFAAVRVGTGAGLGQAVAAFQFAGCQPRYPFFLLFFIAVVENGQGTDAGVGAEAHAEGMRSPDGLGDEHGGLEIQAHAAVFLWNRASEESEFTGFAHQARNEAFLLAIDFFQLG